MTPQERKAFELALEMVQNKMYAHAEMYLKEALAQEKALQALHDENERLGLYKDAYEQQSNEQGDKPVTHCEAGPNYCWKCLEEAKPTYSSEEIRKLREVNKRLSDHFVDVNTKVEALREIGDFAHDKSTRPAVPDALWEIRSMAYDAMENTHPPVPIASLAQQELLTAQPKEPPVVAELLCVCGAEWEWRNRDWELVSTQPQQNPQRSEDINLSCKSTQARLAASWGYVKAEPLSDEQIDAIDIEISKSGYCQMKFARAIEKAHGIGCETTFVKAKNERLE